MKKLSIKALFIAGFCAVLLTACNTNVVSEEDVVAVRQVLAERAAAIEAKDIARYRAVFMPDYFDGKYRLDDVVREMEQAFQKYDSVKLSMQKSPVDVKMNSARVIQRIVYDVVPADKAIHGQEILLLRRIGEEWKISGGVQLGLL